MNQSDKKEKLRIDKYLWSIRIFKTRSQASAACEAGKVKQQGISIKPSKAVAVGDVFEIKTEHRKWVIQVKALLDKRVQYAEAILHYTDLTPPEELQKLQYQAASFNTGKRLSKIGRPTKKHRRDLDNYFDID